MIKIGNITFSELLPWMGSLNHNLRHQYMRIAAKEHHKSWLDYFWTSQIFSTQWWEGYSCAKINKEVRVDENGVHLELHNERLYSQTQKWITCKIQKVSNQVRKPESWWGISCEGQRRPVRQIGEMPHYF